MRTVLLLLVLIGVMTLLASSDNLCEWTAAECFPVITFDTVRLELCLETPVVQCEPTASVVETSTCTTPANYTRAVGYYQTKYRARSSNYAGYTLPVTIMPDQVCSADGLLTVTTAIWAANPQVDTPCYYFERRNNGNGVTIRHTDRSPCLDEQNNWILALLIFAAVVTVVCYCVTPCCSRWRNGPSGRIWRDMWPFQTTREHEHAEQV